MPSNWIIACDSFKGTLTATEVVDTIAKTLRTINPTITGYRIPLSDGGDGFLDVIQQYLPGEICGIPTYNSLLESIQIPVWINHTSKTIYVESALVIGLAQTPVDKRNPLNTSSYGVGYLLQELFKNADYEIVIGLGGSSTNDLGKDMLVALGFSFLDSQNQPLAYGGKSLLATATIVASELPRRRITVLCDVQNPLTGEHGATNTFAAQKGADIESIKLLESGMIHTAKVMESITGANLRSLQGGGSAGGLGAAFSAFLNGSLVSGSQWMVEVAHLESLIEQADGIITGEGCLDHTSFNGKILSKVVSLGKKYHKPVIALVGICKLTEHDWRSYGLFEVVTSSEPTDELPNSDDARFCLQKAVLKWASQAIIKRAPENR